MWIRDVRRVGKSSVCCLASDLSDMRFQADLLEENWKFPKPFRANAVFDGSTNQEQNKTPTIAKTSPTHKTSIPQWVSFRNNNSNSKVEPLPTSSLSPQSIQTCPSLLSSSKMKKTIYRKPRSNTVSVPESLFRRDDRFISPARTALRAMSRREPARRRPLSLGWQQV